MLLGTIATYVHDRIRRHLADRRTVRTRMAALREIRSLPDTLQRDLTLFQQDNRSTM